MPGGLPVSVGITGMGPLSAARAAAAVAKEKGAACIVNAGICGALKRSERFAPGTVFAIDTVVDRTDAPVDIAIAPIMVETAPWQLPTAGLATVSLPVFDTPTRTALARHADLVDMEGAAVVRAATEAGLICRLMKGVTDRAVEGQRQTLHANVGWVSARIARALLDVLPPLAAAITNPKSRINA